MDFKRAREGERHLQSWMKALRELAWLTQLGISLITPPLLCAGLCWWAIGRFGWPEWSMLPALALGFGAAAISFYNFYKYMQRKSERTRKKEPPAFNDHR